MTTTPVMLSVLILALVAAIWLWDVCAPSISTDTLTVSEVMSGWSRRHPALPLAIGFVLGHIFWGK